MSLDDYASKNKGKSGGGQNRSQNRGPNRGQRNTRRPRNGGGGPVFERTARNLRQTGRRKAPYNKPSRADGRWRNDKFNEIQEEDEFNSIVPQQPASRSSVSATTLTVAGDLRNTLKAQATKLFVSNVEKQITQDELLQLFAGIGTVKSIELHFDKDGKSLGTALVNYASRANAELAFSEFSGRMLDGEELLIEFVGSATAPAETTSSSVTIDPLQSIQSAPVYVNNSYNGDYENEEDEDQSSFWGLAAGGSNRRGNRGPDRRAPRRGRRRQEGRNNNRRNNDRATTVSADDLDAQMDAYRSKAKKDDE